MGFWNVLLSSFLGLLLLEGRSRNCGEIVVLCCYNPILKEQKYLFCLSCLVSVLVLVSVMLGNIVSLLGGWWLFELGQ